MALRRAIVDDDRLGAAQRAKTLSELADGWLARLFADVPDAARRGYALVAVGGYGRRELLPGSDLDVVLLVTGRGDPGAVADAVFYPVWDAGLALDHSVRTLGQALDVAADDLKAALGLIDARHVAGDEALTDELRAGVRDGWRKQAAVRLPELAAMCRDRAASVGELAHLLEPDLVQAYGGLRDTLALRAVTASWIADRPRTAGVDLARQWLLTVRDALHRTTGRRQDRLLFENQDDVAAKLGLPDADPLLRRVAEAGRSIAYASDVTWSDVERTLAGRKRRGRRQQLVRRALADGVDEYDGEVVLGRDADPAHDAVLPLRMAAAAAQAGLVPSPTTLARLAGECPPLPEPWPAPALDALVSLLGAGPGIVPVWDALEAAGLVVRWFPEWERIRYRPTRTPVHRHTVDRHLVETALVASRLTRRVARPDVLLLAALVHDLGKGVPGDHSAAGEPIAAGLGRRVGLSDDDAATLGRLVRHHLLLPETATRRDPDDPATLAAVVDAVGTREFLDLLACLTEADATAAGPIAWSPLRSRLVGDLVERTRRVLAGAPPPEPGRLTAEQAALAAQIALTVEQTVPAERDGSAPRSTSLAVQVTPPDDATGLSTVTVVAPQGQHVLGAVAGVLALHRLDVRSASAYTAGAAVVLVWRVVTRRGSGPDEVRLREDVARALGGSLGLGERLAARAAEWRGRVIAHARPQVELLRDVSADATVLEVRAHDEPGLLHRLATALSGPGVVIRSAVVGTLGSEAIDVFYLVDGAGAPLEAAAEETAVAAARFALTGATHDTDGVDKP
ncbi:UTP--GlnB (protein PII) uridylyltransferase, GlnD [Jiangella alkaliphila]|uniref:Bifunctional uridylyltransferase/uridylyl-removing enzyme n=1 Tax=Jiangella alkaliphila TaxID=419479 RepID=A0A1H2KWT7_9ACTN|nr:UTP--GlnB (protein PII) uridylyltransferase, GlnD [Jiangella alkaliphila]